MQCVKNMIMGCYISLKKTKAFGGGGGGAGKYI